MVLQEQKIYRLLDESYRVAKDNYDFVKREKRKADFYRLMDKVIEYDPRRFLYRKEIADFTYALSSFVP